MKLLVIAHIHAQPNHVEDLKAALQELVAATQQETGCLKYTLYQNAEANEQFMMYEQWESAAHLEQHQKTAHINTFREKAGSWLAGGLQVETLPYPTENQ